MNNPILAFSARRRMRSVRTPLLITIYAFVLSLIGYFTIYACFLRPAFTLRNMQQTLYGYMAILTLQFVLLVLVAPAMTAGSVSGERERQTLDLLLVTNMGAGSCWENCWRASASLRCWHSRRCLCFRWPL